MLIIILSALFGLLTTLTIPALSASQLQSQQLEQPQEKRTESTALQLAQQGQEYYDLRQFDKAIELWNKAAKLYEREGDPKGKFKSLVNTSQALKALGLYPRACNTLLTAFAVENPQCNKAYDRNLNFQQQLDTFVVDLQEREEPLSSSEIIALRSLGDVLRRLGILEKSEQILQVGLAAATGTPEEGFILLSLGNTQRAIGNLIRQRWDYEQINKIIDQGNPQIAIEPHQAAFNYYQQAEQLNDSPEITRIHSQINHYTLLWDIQQWWNEQANRRIASGNRIGDPVVVERSERFLVPLNDLLEQELNLLGYQLLGQLNTQPNSREEIYARINLAQTLIQQGNIDQAEQLLEASLEKARILGDKQAESYSLGYLGNVFYQRGDYLTATKLTRQALTLAQEQNLNGDAREVTYLWQSQLGRLLRTQGDNQGAIAAYTAAFNTLQSLRADLNTNNQDVQFNFRDEVKPVYLELVDLLLSPELTDAEIESLVILDLKTTLGRETTETKEETTETEGIKQQKPSTIKRLELARMVVESLQIAELDNFFQDPCSEVIDTELKIDEIDEKAVVIYPIILPERLELIVSFPGKPLSRFTINVPESQVNATLDSLYDYLDNPTVSNSARNIILYTVNPSPEELKENIEKILPIFSELYDWFIQPLATELTTEIETLVFVLNGPLQRVPMAALYHDGKYLIEQYNIAVVPSLDLVDTRQIEKQQIRVLAAGVSEAINIEGRQTFPPLSNVPTELEKIQATFPNSQQLLNQNFTEANFQQQIQDSDFSIIHLATHGLFSSQPENNFIITGDENIINIQELSDLLNTLQGESPELLVLSACETAIGDERAVLGLAGVAVRSGARSTLASLWSVGDESTATLMAEFYSQFSQAGVKKAQALRSAQLSLIDSLRLGEEQQFQDLKDLPPHPYYWAPYILVGNWQ